MSPADETPLVSETRTRISRKWIAIVAGLIIALVGGSLAFLIYRNQTPSTTFTLGSALYCGINSKFVQSLGFTGVSAMDTRSKYVKGVMLRELDQNGNITRSYQDPTWSSAGYLGALQHDELGNVYLIPMPFISVLENPPAKANIISRIDTDTGKLLPFVELPAAAPLTSQNVYGLMDITYDCDTRYLYASSVLGSTPDHVAGRIFQIDPSTGTVLSILDGIDAIGLGIFNDPQGKRLYFGLARASEVYSVSLDNNGSFGSDIRLELSLVGLGTKTNERARTIAFQGPSQLVIKTLQFDFNLVAPSETQQTLLVYIYNADQNTWDFTRSQISNE